MREIFRHCPRAAPAGPFLDKGHPGRQPSSARRARLPGKRSCKGGDRRLVRPKGDGACFRDGQLFRGLDFRGDVGSLLLLADNYNRATTGHHRGTERTEDAQRLFWQRFRGRLQLAGPCGAAGRPRPAACRSWLRPLSGSRLRSRCAACGAGPSGIAAMSSGRAGLPGKRSY
jgi:hypothetical protein